MLGKNIPQIILLNAESRVKTTPIKPQRSTVQTIEAEDIKVTKLPNQEESGDSDEFVDNEEDDDNTYLLKKFKKQTGRSSISPCLIAGIDLVRMDR